MEPIQKIDIPNITIPQFGTNEVWLNGVPFVPSNHPSVTTQIGFPIVEMPGCVKMHQDNKDHVTRMPFDHDLVNQDEDGVTTLCPHGEYPSYDAMDDQPEQLIITRETPPPPVEPPPTPPEFTPDAIPEAKKEDVACPGPGQLRVGDVTQSGDERVVGHQLIDNGKTCETLYEPTTIIEKFLPPANQASTVTALAVVATAGAAATPLLIRIIRPIIKKLWTTVQKKIGKTPYRPSRDEIKSNQYRQSKGLSPLNFEKMKKKG